MKSTFTKCGLLFTAIILVVTSCVKQEYDLNNLNGEVTIAASGLAFPLGSTKQLKLKDFLDSVSTDILNKDNGGAYFLKLEGGISLDDVLPKIIDKGALTLENLSYLKDHLYSKSAIVLPPDIGDGDYTIPEGILPEKSIDTKQYDVHINMDLPEEVVSLNNIILSSNAKIKVSVSVKDPFISKGTLIPAIDVDLSEILEINGKDEPIHLSELVLNEENNYTNSKIYDVTDLHMDFINLSGKVDIKKTTTISGKVSLKSAVTNKATFENSSNMALELTVTYIDLDVEQVDANIDYNVDGIHESVSLTDLPDFLKRGDVCLDLYNPYLKVDMKTNMGLPVKGTMELVGYKDGAPIPSTDISIDVDFPFTKSSKDTLSKVLWIGKVNENIPSGVTFIQANISRLLMSVPDSIVVTVNGYSDPTKNCHLELDANYVIDMDYDFVIPVSFGENFQVIVSDTLNVQEMGLDKLLQKNIVNLVGSVKNSLPLSFSLALELLDSNNAKLASSPIEHKINACNGDFSASTSDLDIKFSAPSEADITKLAKIKVTFKIEGKERFGVPVTENNYIQAELAVKLPEGITFSGGNNQ